LQQHQHSFSLAKSSKIIAPLKSFETGPLKNGLSTGVSPRKFETPEKHTIELGEQRNNTIEIVDKRQELVENKQIISTTIAEPIIMAKARNYSLNQMNRKLKVPMSIHKANF
jgi:hypothetical protein